jgi:hypothetical protein
MKKPFINRIKNEIEGLGIQLLPISPAKKGEDNIRSYFKYDCAFQVPERSPLA